jgi:hypothetical protein
VFLRHVKGSLFKRSEIVALRQSLRYTWRV